MESGEVDDLLVCFYLREVGVDSDVSRQRRRNANLGVEARLPVQVTPARLPADTVVLGLHGPAECIRIQLQIAGTVQIAEIGDRSFIVQAVEPLRPAVRAPEVFLVLPSNEAADIEPELRVGAGVKP